MEIAFSIHFIRLAESSHENNISCLACIHSWASYFHNRQWTWCFSYTSSPWNATSLNCKGKCSRCYTNLKTIPSCRSCFSNFYTKYQPIGIFIHFSLSIFFLCRRQYCTCQPTSSSSSGRSPSDVPQHMVSTSLVRLRMQASQGRSRVNSARRQPLTEWCRQRKTTKECQD